MTRLSTQQALPPTPRSVVLGELAVAAGVAGRPVALLFDDYPGTALGELWRYFARGLQQHEVVHVHTQADVRRLQEHLNDIRLVFVHTPRLHDAVMWRVQMALPLPGEIASCPAVFTRGVPEDSSPGAAVVLRCEPQESAAISRWSLLTGQDGPEWDALEPPTAIQMVPALIPLLAFDFSSYTDGIRCIRDRHVLHGLLVGAGLRRSCQRDAVAGDAMHVSYQDYALVRSLLQSQLVVAGDVPVDPLAVAMVNRANVYLDVKYDPGQTEANPFQADEFYDRDRQITESRGRPLVTRREIADLGNLRSGLVRRLIEQLQSRNDGFELFGRMGLARRPPNSNDWPNTSANQLAQLLQPWTVKQVRTHFERLHKASLITAERHPSNGPWRYLLPEEFHTAHMTFADLPAVEHLTAEFPEHAAG